MRVLSLLIALILSNIGNAQVSAPVKYSLVISNDNLINTVSNGISVPPQRVNLGTVGLQGCKSPNLVKMNQISILAEGAEATCREVKTKNSFQIFITIPVTIKVATSNKNLIAQFVTQNSTMDFPSVFLSNQRGGNLGQGLNLINPAGTVLKPGDILKAQLEIGATIYGPGAKSEYLTSLVLNTAPTN